MKLLLFIVLFFPGFVFAAYESNFSEASVFSIGSEMGSLLNKANETGSLRLILTLNIPFISEGGLTAVWRFLID
jgi:hypothetical protein